MVAHGSGIDELIAFLAFPAVVGVYLFVRNVVRRLRGWQPPAEPEETTDEQREPGAGGTPPDASG